MLACRCMQYFMTLIHFRRSCFCSFSDGYIPVMSVCTLKILVVFITSDENLKVQNSITAADKKGNQFVSYLLLCCRNILEAVLTITHLVCLRRMDTFVWKATKSK